MASLLTPFSTTPSFFFFSLPLASSLSFLTDPSPPSDEYHLNSDIALAIWQYYAATGNDTWLAEVGYPVLNATADMFASFVVLNETTGQYETFNETSPDEYSNHKNNSALSAFPSPPSHSLS